jgi:hypothetical protein
VCAIFKAGDAAPVVPCTKTHVGQATLRAIFSLQHPALIECPLSDLQGVNDMVKKRTDKEHAQMSTAFPSFENSREERVWEEILAVGRRKVKS